MMDDDLEQFEANGAELPPPGSRAMSFTMARVWYASFGSGRPSYICVFWPCGVPGRPSSPFER
jgi:hypothetical protein